MSLREQLNSSMFLEVSAAQAFSGNFDIPSQGFSSVL